MQQIFIMEKLKLESIFKNAFLSIIKTDKIFSVY